MNFKKRLKALEAKVAADGLDVANHDQAVGIRIALRAMEEEPRSLV